jgi:hypothetical protein
MSPIYNPTLEDFLGRARQEFHFLIVEFGFREQALPRHGDLNQFQVAYFPAGGYFPTLADCEAKEA